jgi:hypothetical protein
MKGMDLTPEQLAAAEDFLNVLHHGEVASLRGHDVSMPFEQLVRLIAWYGAVRAMAVARGASVQKPEGYFINPKSVGEV